MSICPRCLACLVGLKMRSISHLVTRTNEIRNYEHITNGEGCNLCDVQQWNKSLLYIIVITVFIVLSLIFLLK